MIWGRYSWRQLQRNNKVASSTTKTIIGLSCIKLYEIIIVANYCMFVKEINAKLDSKMFILNKISNSDK